MTGFLREMPVPDLAKESPDRLQTAVRAYFAAANEFSAKNSETKAKRSGKGRPSAKSNDSSQLLFNVLDLDSPEAVAAAREQLRALHWRVDAEVLRLYALRPEIERDLLDFFDGVPRVGVPFEQTGYIPSGFREVQRLDEFLRITDEWDQTDERRCELIERRLQRGRRTAEEEAEFKGLQRLFDLRRAFLLWRETGDAHSPIVDVRKFKQLQEEDGRWPELR